MKRRIHSANNIMKHKTVKHIAGNCVGCWRTAARGNPSNLKVTRKRREHLRGGTRAFPQIAGLVASGNRLSRMAIRGRPHGRLPIVDRRRSRRRGRNGPPITVPTAAAAASTGRAHVGARASVRLVVGAQVGLRNQGQRIIVVGSGAVSVFTTRENEVS